MDLTVLHLAVPKLSAAIGLALLSIAHDAIVQSLHLAAAISAAVAIGAAIMVVILLRRVPASSELEPQPEMEPDGAVAGSAGVEKGLVPAAAPEKP